MAHKKNLKSTINRATAKNMPRRPELFWDVDPKTIDPEKHAKYIIERILDFGKDKEMKWVWDTYPKSVIYTVVQKSRIIQPQTRALWQLLTK